MKNANEILIRCSGLGNLFTKPKGKTVAQRYNEANLLVSRLKSEYAAIGNKGTKTAFNKLKAIQKANNTLLELEPLNGKIEISESAQTFLLKTYAQEAYGRRENIKSKYLAKGNAREQDAITVLSLHKQVLFVKNAVRLKNEFVTGELDTFIGEEITKAKETFDTKASWSLSTFLQSQFEPLSLIYEYQGHGYMWLSGAERHTVAYCLVNGTRQAINDEKRKLAWELGAMDGSNAEESPEYIEGCRQIEINHIFDINAFYVENPDYEFHNDVFMNTSTGKAVWDFDIPIEKRIHMKSFARDENKIKMCEEAIKNGRQWMNENLFNK